MNLSNWTVDYGDGPTPVEIPHAWRQDVPVTWEGPAVYRAEVPGGKGRWIVFHGVSYEAQVFAGGTELGIHRGVWDAFAFPLPDSEGPLQIEVRVTKNGGKRFPVRDVASGFLPFVFNTFGGIYKLVEIVEASSDPTAPPELPEFTRARSEGVKVLAPSLREAPSATELAQQWLAARAQGRAASLRGDGVGGERPFYARGVLTWGWYPELGHTNPPEETIRREIETAKHLGFNVVKFCLWVPPHRYLELLRDTGMWAWIELPLWDPTPDIDAQDAMAEELDRIVRQHAQHPNIVFWTCGCELHETTSAGYRQRLYESTKRAVGGALVKDNSGSAEMYGGDLREYGDFYDFHPYCDLPFYDEVLDSLMVGPRLPMPILLGEFNDIDVHRNLARLREEAPFWLSQDPSLNDQGVRWQHDLPSVMPENRFAANPGEHRHEALMASSKAKARFIRKLVQEAVRARSDIGGYVVTGWRDTPISSAGMVDDWDDPRFTREDLAAWNGPSCLFQIPTRRPPWVRGGNRPGWIDPFNWFVGRAFWKIGIHSEAPLEGQLEWDVLHFSWDDGRRPQGRVAHGSGEPCAVEPLVSKEVGQINWEAERPGGYLLRVRFGDAENSWPIWIVPAFDVGLLGGWAIDDPDGWFEGINAGSGSDRLLSTRLGGEVGATRSLRFLQGEGTHPMPFWRESAYEFANSPFWDAVGYREQWERLLPMTPDCVLDEAAVRDAHPGFEWETLLNRIDVRTYREHPVLMSGTKGDRQTIVTTLRPFGGLGSCPRGLRRNPSGAEFLRRLVEQLG